MLPFAIHLGLWMGISGAVHAAVPRALLVSVGDPEVPGAGWPVLAADADVAVLGPALSGAGAEVRTIQGAAATPDGVRAAIAEHLGGAGAGGHVLLHVSAHGTRVPDADGDEADGWDEALVLHAGGSAAGSGWLLTDDALSAELHALRRRLGPAGSVAVTLDACHAAGALRGEAGQAPAVLDWSDAVAGEGGEGLAPLVLLAGAREDERAQDVRGPDGAPIGAFSLALAETLQAGAVAWRDVHAGVRYRVSARVRGQAPVLLGHAALPVLGSGVHPPDAHARVVQRPSPGAVRLDRGWLHGLEVGDAVRLWTATHEAEGSVVDVGVAHARVAVELGGMDPGAARAVLARRGPGHRLRVAVDPAGPAAGPLREAISREPLLTLVDDPGGADAWRDAEGRTGPWGWGEAEEGLAELRARALRERVLRLARAPAGRRVAPTLVSATPGTCDQAEAVPRALGGEAVVRVGETVGLRLDHEGRHAAFVTVLHEDALGRVRQLAPRAGEGFVERRPGESWAVPGCWRVAPPVGAETLHVLASRSPVDLRPLLRGGTAPADMLEAVSLAAVELAVLPSAGGR